MCFGLWINVFNFPMFILYVIYWSKDGWSFSWETLKERPGWVLLVSPSNNWSDILLKNKLQYVYVRVVELTLTKTKQVLYFSYSFYSKFCSKPTNYSHLFMLRRHKNLWNWWITNLLNAVWFSLCAHVNWPQSIYLNNKKKNIL